MVILLTFHLDKSVQSISFLSEHQAYKVKRCLLNHDFIVYQGQQINVRTSHWIDDPEVIDFASNVCNKLSTEFHILDVVKELEQKKVVKRNKFDHLGDY